MKVEDLFGIDYPLLQAPMAGVQGSALAIAVSGAGGLGALPCAMLAPDTLREELIRLRAALGRRFNLNFFCHQLPAPDAASEARWQAALAPYYREFGLEPQAPPAGGGRRPFDEQGAAFVEEFQPAVVSFHFGLPEPALLARVKAAGSRVIGSATTVEEARWLESHGADAVIAQGLEAGGHRGMFLTEDISSQLGTFALLPQVVDAIDLPVIAAGGIGDARSIAAARALGAAAVQVGTAYLLCPECSTSELHRRALASEAVRHTVITNVFSGRPARGMINRIVRELGPTSDAAPAFPLASAAVTVLRRHAEAQGSSDFSPLWAGQNAKTARAIGAGELTRELARGFQ